MVKTITFKIIITTTIIIIASVMPTLTTHYVA